MVRSAATALTALLLAAGVSACGSSRNPAASTTFTAVTGIVTDPHGVAVPGATVSVTQGGTGGATTDSQGRYTVTGHFVGTIVTTVSISGATLAVRNVTLTPAPSDPNTAEADIQIDAASLASSA